MIGFNYETNFKLEDEDKISDWISQAIQTEGCREGEINYVFCDDEYLYKLNKQFLNHDDYTDIISFDYTLGKIISGDVFISVNRVKENAVKFSQSIDNEINRVMIHGLLHYMGFRDKSDAEKAEMRLEEDECLKLLRTQ